jgi:hypothetical protein
MQKVVTSRFGYFIPSLLHQLWQAACWRFFSILVIRFCMALIASFLVERPDLQRIKVCSVSAVVTGGLF